MNNERGFSLVTAIFLIVVLAGLASVTVTLFTLQQQNSAQDVLGSRAYQAARSGAEWGAFAITQSAVVGPTYANNCLLASSGTPTTSTVPMAGTLADFNTVVSCYAAGGVDYLTSTAKGPGTATPGSMDYFERAVSLTVSSSVTWQ